MQKSTNSRWSHPAHSWSRIRCSSTSTLAHNANSDPCEAWITEGYLFDLAPIKALYQKAYRQDSGIIVLQLKDAPAGALVYEFAR